MRRLLAELPMFPEETELSEGKPRRYSTENSRNHPHRGFRQSRSGTDQGEIRDKWLFSHFWWLRHGDAVLEGMLELRPSYETQDAGDWVKSCTLVPINLILST